jgi:hypothetical protein
MPKVRVHTLKRAVRAIRKPHASDQEKVLASEAALLLLTKSIVFGHGRLAVMRLGLAVSAGASVPEEHWSYCARAARESCDGRIQELYRDAAHSALAARLQSASTPNEHAQTP